MEPEEFFEQIKRTFSRASMLPDWLQDVLLEDINAAIENRIRTMALIVQANKKDAVSKNLIDTIAEFYASSLYLQKTTENKQGEPKITLAEKKLEEYKTSLKRSFKLLSSG